MLQLTAGLAVPNMQGLGLKPALATVTCVVCRQLV